MTLIVEVYTRGKEGIDVDEQDKIITVTNHIGK